MINYHCSHCEKIIFYCFLKNSSCCNEYWLDIVFCFCLLFDFSLSKKIKMNREKNHYVYSDPTYNLVVHNQHSMNLLISSCLIFSFVAFGNSLEGIGCCHHATTIMNSGDHGLSFGQTNHEKRKQEEIKNELSFLILTNSTICSSALSYNLYSEGHFASLELNSQLDICCCSFNAIPQSKNLLHSFAGRVSLRNISFGFVVQDRQLSSLIAHHSKDVLPHGSELCLSSSMFSSFEVFGSGPFLSSSCLSSVSVSDALFQNITLQKTMRKYNKGIGRSERVLVESTMMIGCESPYSGGILSPAKISFRCNNSSFLKCYTTYHERQPFSEGENEFNDDTFNVQSDETGGALFGNKNASIILHSCLFIQCSSKTDTGAVSMFSSTGKFVSEKCIVNECSAPGETGGFKLNYIDSGVIFATSITNCSSQSKTCFYWASCKVNPCHVVSCFFDNASSSSYASVTYFWHVSTSILISNCLMQNCRSEGFAPCILFSEEETSDMPSINIKYCLFHNNTAENSVYGHDIHLWDYQQWKEIEENNISDCFSSSESPRITRCDDGDYKCTEISDLSSWLSDYENNHQITADYSVGIDYEQCGFAPLCRSIKYSLERTTSNSNKTLILRPSVFQEEQISIASNNFSVCGLSKNECVVQSSSSLESVFHVSSGAFSVQKVTMLQANAESGKSMPFVVMDGDGSLTMDECEISSVDNTLQLQASFMRLCAGNVELSGVGIAGMNFLSDSFIACNVNQPGSVLNMVNTNFSLIQRISGNGGVIEAHGTFSFGIIAEDCHFENVSSSNNGGGLCVFLQESSKCTLNGTCIIDGCKAENNGGNGGRGGRGGGMFVLMESEGCGLTIGQNVKFSKVNGNVAEYGKDVFVSCGSGVLLESKVNASSFAFFDTSAIPSDVLKLSGSENGDESGVIPLFVYLCKMGTKVIVDWSGRNGMDHNHCGFDAFRCLTVDYCANSRLSESSNEIEVVSSSSIRDEIKISLFGVSISGRIASSSEEGERKQVNVSDEGSATQDWLVGCSSSLAMSRLSFVVKDQLNSRRSAFIHSTSTINMTNCSVSFEGGALTDGKIGYNVINIEGGELIVDGFVMEGGVTMNEKSPISMTSGVELEILNSRVIGVEVNVAGGSGGGGCLNVGMKEGGCVNIEESNLSSICSGGSEMKGGGMMISVGSGGSLEMKNVNLSECEVPSEDSSEKKGGLGGAVFAELPEQMGSFVLEGMIFSQCNAWKGKNMFVSGWVLSKIVNKEHFKWEMSEGELGSLDELCGWERKTTGEEGYVIPLVVYLWSNWSGNGFVSKDGGGDFSGCGFSEAPCSSIDHLISLRYEPLDEDSESQKVVIEGTMKGTAVIISDEDENDLIGGSLISSCVSLTLENLSFSNPNPNIHHEILIESSGANICLSVVDCSFGSLNGMADAGFCVMKVNGGRVVVQGCSLDAVDKLKGFIAFSAAATMEVIVEDVNISNVGVKERSLISMGENRHSNNEKVVIKVNGSSFTNITNGENRAGVLSVDSFARAMECVLEGCSVSSCRSEMSEEGGGMKVCLKRGESEVRVVGCSLGMCSCSGVKGRGGGVMVDALDPNEGGASGFGPVGIRMENVRFGGNEAFVGKDVFIRCESIAEQINETLFVLDLSQDALKSSNSICGSDKERDDVDLIPLITFYYGQQVFVSASGRDDRQCGAQNNPCLSIDSAVKHIQRGIVNMLLIDGEGAIGGECVIGDMNVKSLKKTRSTIHLDGKMEAVGDEGSVVVSVNESAVEKCEFLFGLSFESEHSSIVKVKNGTLGVSECWWKSVGMMALLNSTIVEVESGELEMEKCVVSCVSTSREILSVCEGSKAVIYQLRMSDIESEDGRIVDAKKAKMEAKEMSMSNITRQNRGSIVKIVDCAERVDLMNCSMRMCLGKEERGWMVSVCKCECVNVDCCEFDGEEEENEERSRNEQNEGERREEICKWNGSMVEFEKSEVEMKVTSMRNSKKGGLSVSGGNVVFEKGEFVSNNPSIGKYPSARRNILCSDSAQLNIMSLKGGDGQEKNSSLWILNDGCSLMGIVEERASPLFIPTLRSVETEEKEGVLDVVFRGTLLLPCDLSFRVVSSVGDVEQMETHEISESGFVSEEEVHGTIGLEMVRGAEASAEVRVCILFGDGHSPSATESFILKNRSETDPKGDERIVEGGKEGKSIWPIVVIVCVVFVALLLVVVIVLAVRWRKVKNEAEDLREIVNDNIRKDPKAFEMVTMEMSPEEQWRRAERDAEKRNDERIKKRVYGKQMQHSESSEHLLSESGSTEYILGRDSDKIPQWALEKVDEKEEEEETRKRTPSPSISSTSTTDSDSTFVQREDLCPTTSSMSNLVDAMACSSPHEKLIVDLRDSLFMLLHGRNKTKEMAIGTLQEREQTAAQILFWVANGALHSFDEMENPLQSLSSLSPHIVLFSEHMVICIVMHSDLLSDDDSDSSSISSSTVVTSASENDEDDDSLPSSAFEDEDDFKKECLRWKAPELLINKKMGATKESVAFSIGMMVWECLTLQVPFGDYEAEVAGQKIVNGERPVLGSAGQSSFCSVLENCLNSLSQKRPSLATLKRELFQHFPPGAMVLTASDAIDRTMDSQQSGRGASSELACSESEILENRN
ncbi:uncharacterized protein MONOS_14288 [Monocercomonoides exilis]|uniref:uncharacterized protein n=1 Tax=Monocercomonoides exilis TaxID=2049356 RepID=UPI00355A4EB1|nr:hypothetical protein MONOS_14288 [Monocercomonoides exilis]